jgi:hypothetical protein
MRRRGPAKGLSEEEAGEADGIVGQEGGEPSADVGALEKLAATGRGADRGIASGDRCVSNTRLLDRGLAEALAAGGPLGRVHHGAIR